MVWRFSVAPAIFIFLLASSLSTIGCEAKEPPSGTAPGAAKEPAAPSRSSVKLGSPIHSDQMVPLANIAKDTTKYAKTTVKTEGRITSVCQAMGCWMEISDASGEAHIRMSGHSFFIPKDAAGRRAIVEGTVLARPDNGTCEKEAAEATGKTVKVELDATGVELL
jgi:hypothetical protein